MRFATWLFIVLYFTIAFAFFIFLSDMATGPMEFVAYFVASLFWPITIALTMIAIFKVKVG